MALRCPDPKCPNHEDSGDNMRFRGVQKLRPQTPEESVSGAPREKDGEESFYCYRCGKKALGSLTDATGTDDEVDALLPAPPIRPVKSGDESLDKKES